MANSAAAKSAQRPKGDSIFAKITKFIRESYVETRFKSAWPTWAELRQFTIVVIFAVAVVAAWIGVIDVALRMITQLLGR